MGVSFSIDSSSTSDRPTCVCGNARVWLPRRVTNADMSDTIRISRIVCDFLILSCCAIPLLIFHVWVKPYKRGFYCDDETIRYPYRDSTVSRQMLIVIGLLIPTLLIIATEIFRTMAWERKCESQFKTYHLKQYSVHRLVVRLYCFIGKYFFVVSCPFWSSAPKYAASGYFFLGVCFNQLMVDIAKYTIGRQRPHFMDVCRPDIGYSECKNPDLYITNFTCTGPSEKLILESQLSFYSGHAAFSFYGAWFTSLYLQARLYRPLFSRLLLPVIQFSLFGGASYVALTRVSDYKHHWSDVLVGALIGSAIGIFTALYVAEVFKRREIPDCVRASDEFGLIRMEKRSDVVPPAVTSATHTVTVSNEHDPSLNQRLDVTSSASRSR
ncbi:PhosphoLipid PhosPhatase [Trichostrongylus colubriformis]|uniref:PhosphoLipid PhosPhatase n=1 Tax=Trichostrongylus colubriformis TaxID=6319 RepID=A0AAN8IV99_TRICO